MVYGNLAHAVSVGVLVGGVNIGLAGIKDFAAAAQSLQNQASMLHRGQSAVVAWMGYSAPDLIGAVGPGPGAAGAKQLARFVQNDLEPNTSSRNISLIGHSYGSYVVSRAVSLLSDDSRVTNAIFLASPGVDPALRGSSVNLWSGVNYNDPILACQYGCISTAGPAAFFASWGSQIRSFQTNGPGYQTINGHGLYSDPSTSSSSDFQGYLDPRTLSVLNVAQIMTGGPVQ